jgi:hypothetical protein
MNNLIKKRVDYKKFRWMLKPKIVFIDRRGKVIYKNSDWLGNTFEEGSETGELKNVNGEDKHKFTYDKDIACNSIRTDTERGEKHGKVTDFCGNVIWEKI